MASTPAIPLWFKLVYTVFVVVLVPFYAVGHGLANFLWFSNIALLSTVVAIWFEWRLLASMQLVSVGVLELVWTVGFVTGLALGGAPRFGLTGYMFDEDVPLHLRALSLYHIPMPWILLWLVWRLGYDGRAWMAQTLLAWVVLVVCYLVTDPQRNINRAFGPAGTAQDAIPPLLYLVLLMIALPLIVYLPTHALLRWLLGHIPRPAARAG